MKKVYEEKKRKIAVVRVYGGINYDSYGDYSSSSNIVQHVTDWEEVTEDEFNELHRALAHASTGDYRFMLIEQMDSIFMSKTVADYRKHLKKQEEMRALAEAERLLKAEEAKLKREKKKLEKLAKDKENFKKLASEMGLKVVDEEASA